VLRAGSRTTTLCLCAKCQRSSIIVTTDLLGGDARCPNCSPPSTEQREAE